MNVLIFKTDIATRKKVREISTILNNLQTVRRWTVDMEDIDNVLRIEASGPLQEHDIVELIKPLGFHCEDLPE